MKNPLMTPLQITNLRKSMFKWRLDAVYAIKVGIFGHAIQTEYLRLWSNGALEIQKGYCWDGPSGPAIDTQSFRRGSLVHDALYQLMREEGLSNAYKDHADNLMREICLKDGMWPGRAWYCWKAVQWFGRGSLEPRGKNTQARGFFEDQDHG